MTSRRLATGLCVAYGVLFVGRMALALSTGSLDDQGGFWFNLLSAVMLSLFPLLFLAVGWAIVTRQPRNTIGWLLLAIPLIGMLGFFVGDYATQALTTDPGSLPFGRAAAWLDRWLIVAALGVFIPLFLLFPDGHVPSRRWRPALWLVVVSTTLTIVGFALTPGPLTGAFADLVDSGVTNPLGIDTLAGPIATITAFGGFLMLASAIVSGAAIVVRFRHASGEVRQQIKWLAFVGVAFLLEIPLTIAVDAISHSDTAGDVMFLVGFATLIIGIPLACGVAILKYRLYDLDVVVRKTVVFGLLAVFIAVVYAAVVGLLGALVGGVSNSVASFVAATVLAIAFQHERGGSPTDWSTGSARRRTRCSRRSRAVSARPMRPTTSCRGWQACWRPAPGRTPRRCGCASPPSSIRSPRIHPTLNRDAITRSRSRTRESPSASSPWSCRHRTRSVPPRTN
jgi:xanthosine utilization system XapX-like protein